MKSRGDTEYCAGLVAFNALFQVLFFPVYAWLFLSVLPGWLGLETFKVEVRSASGVDGVRVSRHSVSRRFRDAAGVAPDEGDDWYRTVFVPRISPLTLIALLFTILVMFSLKGELIVRLPLDVRAHRRAAGDLFRRDVPAELRALRHRHSAPYGQTATLSFTAASNNFELASRSPSRCSAELVKPSPTVIGPLVGGTGADRPRSRRRLACGGGGLMAATA